MIIVEQPYLSPFLRDTIVSCKIPVLNTTIAHQLGIHPDTILIEENIAQHTLNTEDSNSKANRLYTTSENALEWIINNLPNTKLPEWVGLFKDKVLFRELISDLYPDFYFREIAFKDLKRIDLNQLSFPLILKPSIGFFSLGVKKIESSEQWMPMLQQIEGEIADAVKLFPEQVLNTTHFIIEQYIEGDEYAFDAYFDDAGEPVILGIFQHIFSSSSDVSDRTYLTSAKIIEDNIHDFTEILRKIAKLTSIRNFPLHVEVRKDSQGKIVPIEVNPLRFGGWCTTADLTHLAYDFNPYEYYFNNLKPDWEQLLADKEDIYSIIILDNSTGLETHQITSFDYQKLLSQFEKPLELRKIDYRKFPLFGFLFTQTRQSNFVELKKILKSDLTEFIQHLNSGQV